MGVYIYCTKPSHVAIAEVETIDAEGRKHLGSAEVALYRYAYKPTYSGWDAEQTNQRWRFRSGAAACAAAYARSSRSVPALGAYFDADRSQVYAPAPGQDGVFLTGGSPEVYDDCVKHGGRIVRWLSLPKGVTEGKQPLDRRLTPTTVLQYQPRALRECVGVVSYWTRLADTASGETQPEWTLCASAEAMVERAAKFGVPLAKAPDEAKV